MTFSALAASTQRSAHGPRTFFARARRRFAALRDTLASPQAWALLSTCDWYPDATGFPASHAALLAPDQTEER